MNSAQTLLWENEYDYVIKQSPDLDNMMIRD